MAEEIKNEELEMEEEDIIELEDEDGKVLNFYHIATFDFKEKTYVVFQPTQKYDSIDEDEVVIFELAESETEEDEFKRIESEEELNEVFEEFMRLVEEDDDCDCGCAHDHDCDCDDCKH